jgi:hypothetical protein
MVILVNHIVCQSIKPIKGQSDLNLTTLFFAVHLSLNDELLTRRAAMTYFAISSRSVGLVCCI